MGREITENGCLSSAVSVAGALVIFNFIVAFAGVASAVWFGLGFIAAAILAFWETGRNTANPAQPVSDEERGQ